MKRLLILLVCICMLLCGCKKDQPPKEDALSLELLQQILDDTMSQAQADAEGTPEYLLEMDERTSVEVTEFEEVEDGYAIAQVTVSAPDLYSVVKSLEDEKFADESEVDEALTEGVKDADLVETELEIEFHLEEGVWTPVLTEEFADACYGGMMTYRQEYYDGLEGVE